MLSHSHKWASVVGLLFLQSITAQAQTGQTLVSYAYDINSSRIVTFDTLHPQNGATTVFNPSDTNLSVRTFAGAIINGLAYDNQNSQLIYRDGSASGQNGNGSLYAWNGFSQVRFTGAALPGASSNAGYWNGAYWYIAQSTDTLVRVGLDFTTPSAPTYTVDQFTNFDNTSTTSFGFGDIAIKSNGMLFGAASNLLFTYDLNGLTNSNKAGRYTQIASGAGVGTLQILYNVDETVLYATERSNGIPTSFTDFYTLNPLTGAKTYTGRLNGAEFADLSGAVSSLSTSTPEPGEWVCLSVFGCGLGSLILRARKAKRR